MFPVITTIFMASLVDGLTKRRVATTTVKWSDLPEEIQWDGFVQDCIDHDVGIENKRVPSDTPIRVISAPIDEVYRELRRNFSGLDSPMGTPAALQIEKHWDDRGPAQVFNIVHYIGAIVPPSKKDDPRFILNAWLSSGPGFSEGWYDDQGYWHVRPDPKGQSPGMAIPPVIFHNRDFIDGRHRIFAARIAGLKFIPLIDLADLRHLSKK